VAWAVLPVVKVTAQRPSADSRPQKPHGWSFET